MTKMTTSAAVAETSVVGLVDSNKATIWPRLQNNEHNRFQKSFYCTGKKVKIIKFDHTFILVIFFVLY